MNRLFLFIYTLGFYCSLPFILLRLFWLSRKNPAYKERWWERLGFYPKIFAQNGIWIHAVSLGETITAEILIRKIQENFPNLPIVITNMTPTGAERTRQTFQKKIPQLYFPYDVPFAIKRFLKTARPRLLIIMETELWPNLIHLCHERSVPILIANARLSEKSARGYQRLGKITRTMMQKINRVAAQTEIEGKRFIQLGLPKENLQITGSLKFDLDISDELKTRAKALRTQLGDERLIWIAGSTHAGEEKIILQTFQALKKQFPALLLFLVPRHPERFSEVAQLCTELRLNIILRSENKSCMTDTDVFLGDTTGELLLFYGTSDIAFIGGSFVEKGGHNPLEPAAWGVPVLMGDSVFNFSAISQILMNAQALEIISDQSMLQKKCELLFSDSRLRKEMGENGKRIVEQNRGATKKHLALIRKILRMCV